MLSQPDDVFARLQAAANEITDPADRVEYMAALEAALRGDPTQLRDLCRWKWKPVSIDTFVQEDYFLGLGDQVYPKILEILMEISAGDYTEVLFTGAIGYGKSFAADLLCAYELYRVTCLTNPQVEFGLADQSAIVFIMQSVSREHARSVLFGNLARLVRRSPYFREAYPLDERRTTDLTFGDGQLVMKPVSGMDTGTLGLNVFGGVLDELNFMPVVTNSKRRPTHEVYDAALANYQSLARRMQSRFMRFGKLPGKLIMMSSKRYPDDFTERKIAEHRADIAASGKSLVYVVDLPQWATREDRLLGPRFRVVVGGASGMSHILPDETPVPDDVAPSQLIDVPIEYRKQFEQDIDQALREIAGRSTLSLRPYIARRSSIEACFEPARQHPFSLEVSTLRDGLEILPQHLDLHCVAPRAVHLDLGLGRPDATGFAMGYAAGIIEVERTGVTVGEKDPTLELREVEGRRLYVERLPVIVIEAMLRIVSPPGDEILLADVSELISKLRDQLKVPIRWVSADSFQSVATLQTLRMQGFKTGILSVEKDTAYGDLKHAIYDRRLHTYRYLPWVNELIALEKDEKTGKVDHPAFSFDVDGRRIPGTKDVADATAGVAFVLSRQRETWRKAQPDVASVLRRSVLRTSVVRQSIPR